MSLRRYPTKPLLAACTAVWREDRFLLAERRISPNEGKWAMPGGLVEVGETLEQAAIREVHEETSLRLERVVFNRNYEIIRHDTDGKAEFHYVLAMFVGVSAAGVAVAGDDASNVGWFSLDTMNTVPLTNQTELFIHESRTFLPQLT